MDFEKLTDRSKEFFRVAYSLALREGHTRLMPEHLLKVLLDDSEGSAAELIQRSGGRSGDALLARIDRALAKMPKGSGQLYIAPQLAKVNDLAEKLAEKAGDSYVTFERLLLALAIENDAETAKILAEAGATPVSLNAAINDLRKGRTADTPWAEQRLRHSTSIVQSPDIFISYSKNQAALTKSLARDLEAEGYTTWWDTSLLPGDEFPEEIKRQLDAAKAVIVIWTESAVNSKWVRAEAALADARRKLITVRDASVDLNEIPLPFNTRHTELVTERAKIFAALARQGIVPSGR